MAQVLIFLKPYWKKGILPTLFLLVSSAIGVVFPLFPKWAIDTIINGNGTTKLPTLMVLFILFVIAQRIFDYLNVVTFFNFQRVCILDIQKRLLKKMFHFPLEFFNNNHSGYLLGRIRGDIEGLGFLFSDTLIMGGIELIKVFAIFIILVSFNLKLSLICFTVIPAVVFKFVITKHKFTIINKKLIETNSSIHQEISDVFQGIELIKTNAKEYHGFNKTVQALEKYQKLFIVKQKLISKHIGTINLIIHLGSGLLLYFGILEIQNHHLTIGEFISFISYFAIVFTALKEISQLATHYDYAKKSFDRVDELLKILPETSGKEDIDKIQSIEVKHLSFSINNGKRPLKQINLR